MEEATCTLDGCDRGLEARGLCHKHYVRWQCSRPEYRERQNALNRARRKTEAYRAVNREYLTQKRRAKGVPPRRSPEEIAAERRLRRRQSRWRRAKKKLEIAARPGRPRKWVAGPCPGCGEPFVSRSEVCSQTCRNRLDRWADRDAYGNHRERARRYGVEYQPVNVVEVLARDGYRCQLCGLKTSGEWPSPTSPTLDHIIPMAVGGGHVASNLQCACFRCNSTKGARAANDQLRLIG